MLHFGNSNTTTFPRLENFFKCEPLPASNLLILSLLPRELKLVKSELVRAIHEKLPELQLNQVEAAINCMLNQMADTLVDGERIEIRGFGSFDLHHRAPHIGRNPMTGESVDLPAKVKVHFKPGKEMKDRVDAARDHCVIIE